MTTETVPAPALVTPAITIPPVSEVKTQESAPESEQRVTPPDQTTETAGSEKSTEPEKAATEEKKPTEAELRRKERNRERWRNMHEAERERDMLKAELALLKPRQTDYSQITDPDELIAERTTDKILDRQRAATEGRLKQAEVRSAEVMLSTWDDMKSEARERIPDFDSVVTDRTPIHPRLAPLIVESEQGADIAYWLGKNPEAARKLYQQFETAPQRALVELGRIEAKLSAPPPKSVTKAPAPAPILSGGANPLQFDPSRASVDDVAAHLKKAGIIR